MKKSNLRGPILLVEDDEVDQEIFSEALNQLDLRNRLVIKNNGEEALEYLVNEETPFIIFSDINMPRMNGLELLRKIEENEQLKKKSIPFIFLSSSSSEEQIYQAYMLLCQGYFEKPSNYGGYRDIIRCAIEYWEHCHVMDC